MPKSVNAKMPSSPTPIDPDDTILDFHFIGDVRQPVFVFAEVLGDASYGCDVMDLVDVHGHAA